MKWVLYVDESGARRDAAWSAKGFVVGGLLVPDDDASRTALDKAVQRAYPDVSYPPHANQLNRDVDLAYAWFERTLRGKGLPTDRRRLVEEASAIWKQKCPDALAVVRGERQADPDQKKKAAHSLGDALTGTPLELQLKGKAKLQHDRFGESLEALTSNHVVAGRARLLCGVWFAENIEAERELLPRDIAWKQTIQEENEAYYAALSALSERLSLFLSKTAGDAPEQVRVVVAHRRGLQREDLRRALSDVTHTLPGHVAPEISLDPGVKARGFVYFNEDCPRGTVAADFVCNRIFRSIHRRSSWRVFTKTLRVNAGLSVAAPAESPRLGTAPLPGLAACGAPRQFLARRCAQDRAAAAPGGGGLAWSQAQSWGDRVLLAEEP